jgi:hypothetical protein
MITYKPGTYLTIDTQGHQYLPIWNDSEALLNTFKSLDEFICYFWESGCLGLYVGSCKKDKNTVGLFIITDSIGRTHFGWQHVETVFRNVRSIY